MQRHLITMGLLIFLLMPWSTAFGKVNIAFLRFSGSFYQIWFMDENGNNLRQLTFSPGDKVNISWSPDGRRLLYNINMGELFVIDVATGKSRPIDIGMKGMTDVEWAPDGKHVLFSLSTINSIDTNDIWVCSLDGKTRRKVTRMPYMQHHPIWVDHGRRIVFLSGKGEEVHDIWITDVEGRSLKQLSCNSGYNFEPSCSIHNKLAFSSNRSGNYEIYVMNLEGKEVKSVTQHPAIDTEPSWSPDGKSLVFASNRSGNLQIWKVNIDGSGLRQLTRGMNPSRTPKWGPS